MGNIVGDGPESVALGLAEAVAFLEAGRAAAAFGVRVFIPKLVALFTRLQVVFFAEV